MNTSTFFVLIVLLILNNTSISQISFLSEEDISFREYQIHNPNLKNLKKEAKTNNYNKMLLGDAYRRGKLVKTNFKKAFKIYEQNMFEKHAESTHRLSFMYRHGLGTIKNYPLGIKLLEKSASFGYQNAFHDLGVIYYLGSGVKQSYSIAEKYFLNALTKSNDLQRRKRHNCYYLLGKIYSLEAPNNPIDINLKKAISYLKKSDKGDEYIELLIAPFESLDGLIQECSKAPSFLPEIDVNINFKSYEDIDILIDALQENYRNILGNNYRKLRSDIIIQLLKHQFNLAKKNIEYTKTFISNFDLYSEWLQSYKDEWCLELEKELLRKNDFSDVNDFNQYFTYLQDRKKLYTKREQEDFNEKLFPLLNKFLSTPQEIIHYKNLVNTKQTWITPLDNSFDEKYTIAVKKDAKNKLAKKGYNYSSKGMLEAIKKEDLKALDLFFLAGMDGNTTFDDKNLTIKNKSFKGKEHNLIGAAVILGKKQAFLKLVKNIGGISNYKNNITAYSSLLGLSVKAESSNIFNYLVTQNLSNEDYLIALITAVLSNNLDYIQKLETNHNYTKQDYDKCLLLPYITDKTKNYLINAGANDSLVRKFKNLSIHISYTEWCDIILNKYYKVNLAEKIMLNNYYNLKICYETFIWGLRCDDIYEVRKIDNVIEYDNAFMGFQRTTRVSSIGINKYKSNGYGNGTYTLKFHNISQELLYNFESSELVIATEYFHHQNKRKERKIIFYK